ncbi:MAG: hypothetical protein SFV51_28305 [Bryobacteraceae bacterium]|nr:hypothetical protein [Bryobacteraceae bacterium]
MTRRLLLLLALGAAALPGQLQVLVVVNNQERPAGSVYSMGTTTTGAVLEARFRIRNTGSAMAQLQTVSIGGVGFELFQEPRTPASILPGLSVELFVRFRSTAPVSDARGTLRVNSASITLLAGSTAGISLYLLEDDGGRTQRTPELTTVFPSPERGATVTRRFVIENPNPAAITVNRFAVTGEGFQFSAAQPQPLRLSAREARPFEVLFRATSGGLKQGALQIDDRQFPLAVSVREPVFPRPLISLERTSFESGAQAKVAIRFDSPSRAEGSGQLRLEFVPGVGARDDAAIQFLPANRRSVAFQVREGQSQASFDGQPEVVFQTGTTVGTIRLIAEAGGWTAEASLTLEGAPVHVESARVLRGTDLIDLSIAGYDNTRTTTEVAFFFYDSNGEIIAPGALRANVESRFRTFFDASPAGGMFLLRAVFPVSGPSATITSFEAEFRNSKGTQRTRRFTF